MSKNLVLLLSLVLLAAAPSAAQSGMPPRDSAFERVAEGERPVNELSHIREADVLWHRMIWQTIDLREKINQPMYFPVTPSGRHRSLMQVLIDGIRDGEITPYSVDTDDFTIPMSPEEVFASLEPVITVTLQRAEPPYDTYDTTYQETFNPADVVRFRIKEQWFFDRRQSRMEVRILGISPVREAIDPVTGEIRGDEPLFWVYFPEARHLLANAPVMSMDSGSRYMSYDDLFLIRNFAGTIYRDSQNPHGRRIPEYMSSLDALYESERIRNEIRNMEENMWEY